MKSQLPEGSDYLLIPNPLIYLDPHLTGQTRAKFLDKKLQLLQYISYLHGNLKFRT